GRAWALALDGPETSLLRTADDGRGTVLQFGYVRSPAVGGTRQRHSVLANLTVQASGQDPITYSYAYGNPTLHRQGKFLIGFAGVTRSSPLVTERAEFLHGDFYAGLLAASVTHDVSSPLVDAFERREYEDRRYLDLDWKRLRVQVKGWKTPG